MHIINLVDTIAPVNFGIWNAAINTAPLLKKEFNVTSHFGFPPIEPMPDLSQYQVKPMLLTGNYQKTLQQYLQQNKLTPANTVIASHGCWMAPTRLSANLHKQGFGWVYTPHGMLEPWSVRHHRWKKVLYWWALEKWLSRKADLVRAVGQPEYHNLQNTFKKVIRIPNGASIPGAWLPKASRFKQVVFIGRLHHKKGILPLVQAWMQSSMLNLPDYQLLIAGPDEGEWTKIKALWQGKDTFRNMRYLGPVFGEAKEQLLQEATFFALPSFSEGFPSSVVEAMGYGLIPLITTGCNFPEAISAGHAIEVTPRVEDIQSGFQQMVAMDKEELKNRSQACYQFIKEKYTLHKVAEMQYQAYSQLLKK